MLAENFEYSDGLSLTGRQWALRSVDERQVIALMQQAQVPEILARVLVGQLTLKGTAAEGTIVLDCFRCEGHGRRRSGFGRPHDAACSRPT